MSSSTSFKLHENQGLLNFAQQCAQIGSRYGNIDMKSVLFSRTSIKDNAMKAFEQIIPSIIDKLKESNAIDLNCLSFTSDIWTSDHNCYSLIDIHATWLNV